MGAIGVWVKHVEGNGRTEQYLRPIFKIRLCRKMYLLLEHAIMATIHAQ